MDVCSQQGRSPDSDIYLLSSEILKLFFGEPQTSYFGQETLVTT